MEEAPVTAATGALGPVIAKLAALLGSEYKLRWCTRRDVKFIRSKLKPVHSILWNIWEKEELDAPSMALKMEALDLADDVEDAIFDFILSMERSRNNKRFVQTKIKASPFQDFKKRASDVSARCRGKWKDKKNPAVSASGKLVTDDSGPGKPRAYPFVRKDASELVGMVEQRDKLIQHLVGEDNTAPVELQLKTATILGMAGMGKTTLADLVYEAIGSKFQSMAFVSVTPGGDMREVLARILQQVAPNINVPLVGTQTATEDENLIDILSNFLKDKRYLVIVDDIWNLRELEMVTKSLPENNLGSRIVGTTRIKVVAEKWPKDNYVNNALIHEMFPKWDSEKGWIYEIGENNIATGMIATKADLVAEGFDFKHPIVHMCGGIPLAVRCMLSAVAAEREKQAPQGLHAKACDLQDEILKHVMENGMQNTPGFEALVESLQLGYVDLPHHMLKTCLLYCSIYPDHHILHRNDSVRRWICEGFVCTEEGANSYFHELVNRGLILNANGNLRMHPMMRYFLRCKSRQDNFITWSSEITPSYNNSCRIRRFCIYKSPCRYRDTAADALPVLDCSHIRSLVVCESNVRLTFDDLEGVQLLDLCGAPDLLARHWNDICGLVRLRHLLGFNGDTLSETPQKVRLQFLETFEAAMFFTRLPAFIGDLQQLKTLEVRGYGIKELPREIGKLQQLRTLKIRHTSILELPREIGSLHQLETLDLHHSWITELPKEISSLQKLKTLDITRTRIRVLPKEIGKLQHLEHLVMNDTQVAKIPREIGALKGLKSLKLDSSIAALPLEVCHASTIVALPYCIRHALRKSDVLSELAAEMLSFQISEGLVVGAIQMHIPPWIKEHFNDLDVLDIRICKLEERGLRILREMPQLRRLTLRFQVVPREPVVISGEGFAMLESLTIDSRVPRNIFQEGAMPMLGYLTFKFQFYAGPPNKDPVGINHLRSLHWIEFKYNVDWYGGDESPCIRPTIDIMRKEVQSDKVLLTVSH